MAEQIWLVRFYHPVTGIRIGVRSADQVYDITPTHSTIAAWLQASSGQAQAAIDDLREHVAQSNESFSAAVFDNAPGPDHPHWLAPVDHQDVWGSGVTYKRSQEARQEEAIDGGDVYARVYTAERPELFFKARGTNVVGMYGAVGIRSDAHWSVPEPELTLVVNPALEVVGMTAGNDMSSRDIEGENPLYLPQAKVYTASCALGNGILLDPVSKFPAANIHLHVRRQNTTVFSGHINSDQIRRGVGELVAYLGRSQSFPDGVLLMTGTGIIPPADFTLQAEDEVEIEIEGIAHLVNTVKVV